jgi:pSer/pThr/pTyr-binding forkhead associated (FHA) protein
VLKCVVGHAIASGAHFCAHGHPIALDALHLTRGSVPAVQVASPPPPVVAALTPMPRSDAQQPVAAPVIMTPVSPMQAFVPAPPPAAAPALAAPVAAPAQVAAPQASQVAGVLRGFLVPLQGRPTQEYWAMHGGSVSVGRANTGDTVDIAVLDSTTSSRHATIHFDTARGVVFVEDLGSTNGTFVNDVPIGHNGRRELRDNDRVRFGGFSAILKLLPLV